MSKKKIMVLVTSALVTVGVVGTTLALFTSQDTVTNKFQTIDDEDNEGDAGIDIYEKFDATKAGKVLPGSVVDKLVQVKNTAKYSQLIKVKITPVWVGTAPQKEVTGNDGRTTKVDIDIMDAIDLDIDTTNWLTVTENNETVYYYKGRIPAGGFTDQLLKTVAFKLTNENEYKNAKYDIKVEAFSTQSNIEYGEDDGWNVLNQYVDKVNYTAKDDPNGVNNQAKLDGTIATTNAVYNFVDPTN